MLLHQIVKESVNSESTCLTAQPPAHCKESSLSTGERDRIPTASYQVDRGALDHVCEGDHGLHNIPSVLADVRVVQVDVVVVRL